MSALVVEDLIPKELLDQFGKFHAARLCRGKGVFKGIDDLMDILFDGLRGYQGKYQGPRFKSATVDALYSPE